jgi:general stress protein 26
LIELKEVPGIREAFKRSRSVILTTYNAEGERHSRPMINYNEDPYKDIKFYTFTETRKVRDIKERSEAVISFPSEQEGKVYRIKGSAKLADDKMVSNEWEWWYLFYHPEKKPEWQLSGYGSYTDHRAIIIIQPDTASLEEIPSDYADLKDYEDLVNPEQ